MVVVLGGMDTAVSELHADPLLASGVAGDVKESVMRFGYWRNRLLAEADEHRHRVKPWHSTSEI